jgi:hypothetical protein
MKKRWIILKLNYILSSIWSFVSLLSVDYDFFGIFILFTLQESR